MQNTIRLALLTVWFLSQSSNLLADPTFIPSTFAGGNEGWQPWATSNANGMSPGDRYLNIAADGEGEKGKMISFNMNPEWTGDYFSSGVTGVQLDISNMSDSDTVFLRVVVGNRASPQQTGGTWFISQTAVTIPVLSSWTRVFLPLAEPDLTVVGNLTGEMGADSYADTFSDIRAIRILSAAIPLGAIGDEFVGDVGIDNVVLVPEPTAVSMIGVGFVTIVLCRKRRRSAEESCCRRRRIHRQLDSLR